MPKQTDQKQTDPKQTDPTPVPSPAPAFEQSLVELEGVVKELESGDVPLEKAIALFERGVALSGACRKQLEEAETRVEILLNKGGEITAEPFGGGN